MVKPTFPQIINIVLSTLFLFLKQVFIVVAGFSITFSVFILICTFDSSSGSLDKELIVTLAAVALIYTLMVFAFLLMLGIFNQLGKKQNA